MSRVVASRVIDAPVGVVWEAFADLSHRACPLSDVEGVELLTPGPLKARTRWRETRTAGSGAAVTEELVIISVDPGRSCTMALAGAVEANQLTYLFAPIDVGAHRGGTAVTAVAERRPHGLANRLLGFLVGGFAARTAEGALREELAALATLSRARLDSLTEGGAAA